MKKRIKGAIKGVSSTLGKEGSSHFEVVIAFTLFIVFTIFLLFFLKAPEESSLSETMLKELETSFMNYTGVEMVSFLIKPNESDCIEVDISSLNLVGNSSVFTLKGAVGDYVSGHWVPVVDDGKRKSKLDGGILTVNASGLNVAENESLRVYISEGIFEESGVCNGDEKFTEIGNIKRERVLSQEKFMEFEQIYNESYYLLKDELGLPSNIDFAVYSEGIIEAQKGVPPNADVFSSDPVFRIVFQNGTISDLKVVLKVW